MKKMVCLITSIDFLSIQPFMRPLFSGQQELSNLDYYFQNGGTLVHKQIKDFEN